MQAPPRLAAPNALIANIHDRSPVVVVPENFTRWHLADEHVEDLLHAPQDEFWMMEKSQPQSADK